MYGVWSSKSEYDISRSYLSPNCFEVEDSCALYACRNSDWADILASLRCTLFDPTDLYAILSTYSCSYLSTSFVSMQDSCVLGWHSSTSTALDIKAGCRYTRSEPAYQCTISLAATCQQIASNSKTLQLFMRTATLTALDISAGLSCTLFAQRISIR